ncbi:hypothetical protein [Thermofilum sp.]|uniref:hypothetical protein n=1 Tax=Thermofilum sp. TaxID=1961369 RepID=UPI00317A6BB3
MNRNEILYYMPDVAYYMCVVCAAIEELEGLSGLDGPELITHIARRKVAGHVKRCKKRYSGLLLSPPTVTFHLLAWALALAANCDNATGNSLGDGNCSIDANTLAKIRKAICSSYSALALP